MAAQVLAILMEQMEPTILAVEVEALWVQILQMQLINTVGVAAVRV
jgi:hypothetical protein